MRSRRFAAFAAAVVMTACACPAVYAEEAGWKTVNGKTVYVMEDGNLAHGMMLIDNVACSFAADGSLIGRYTGTALKNGVLRYYKDGVLFAGGWITDENGTYYFDKNGAAQGIRTIDGVQYYFSSDGRLMTSEASAFTVTADKSSIILGNRDRITFTVKATNLGSEAYFAPIDQLQQLKDGKWYKVKPDNILEYDGEYFLGNVGETIDTMNYVETQKTSFCPDDYCGKLTTGEYRVVIPINVGGKTVKKYCEFRIIESAECHTPLQEYIISQTDEIKFTTMVNRDQKIFTPDVYNLQFYNKELDRWELIEPILKSEPESPVVITAGNAVSSVLDLTAYDRTRLKSGTYRAAVGEQFSCEFNLKNPYDVSAQEVPVESKRVKQINITFVNESDNDITVKGYGTLLRLDGSKWKTVSLKSGKKLDTQADIPAMTKWTKSMTLTDYYSFKSLKSGSYCMKFPCDDGSNVYAYFDIA